MFQKTVEREKPYSKEELKAIHKAFEGLKKFRGSPQVEAYLKKRRAELKGKGR